MANRGAGVEDAGGEFDVSMVRPAAQEVLDAGRRALDVLTAWPHDAAPLVVERVCAKWGCEPTEERLLEAERLLAAEMLDHVEALASAVAAEAERLRGETR